MMERKLIRRWLVLLLLIATAVLGLVACGSDSGDAVSEADAPAVADNGSTTDQTADEIEDDVEDEGEQDVAEAPEATLTLREQIPDVLVIHPDAFDFQVTPASNTYIYVVPGMLTETLEYMEAKLMAKGWEELGKPTIMGHLATLNLQMGKSRLTVSLQDNERSETTRVQMVFFES
jgi:hypothetical protein